MSEVTDVDIAAGIPTGGTGTVPTLSKTNTLLGAVTEGAAGSDTASSGLNGRLQRIAQRITSLIALVPTALGANGGLKVDVVGNTVASATAANQTAQSTLLGAVTETAPASDTASSGLNGRLQRIAQRLSSIIALLPTALGSYGGLKVDIAGVAPPTYTDKSGTITLGGTAQTIAALNTTRRGFMIQNNSTGDLWFSTLATAVASQPSIKIQAGALYESPATGAPTGAISLIGATTAQSFSAREW